MNKHLILENSFSPTAKALRQFFDKNFANTHSLDNKRFVWDYWHVPDQYSLMRTPAYHYFPQKMYLQFHKELLMWGRRNLGCWDISPPWLSYYINGCKQELHSDVPHGPWAFVYSLTPNRRQFTGGETLLLRPQTLSYWQSFTSQQDREQSSFVQKVSPQFNRLIVFDPRIPHGVTEVRGTQDPRQARLVIHGWFTEPKTYIEGPLTARACESVLNEAFDQISELITHFPPTQGVVSLQLQVNSRGQVQSVKLATNTLIHTSGEATNLLGQQIVKIYRNLKFKSARGSTLMTVPLIFS